MSTPRKKVTPPKPKVVTVLDQLETLPSPYKEMAIYAATKEGSISYECESPYDAVGSFSWKTTDSGENFWSDVCDAVENDSEYPEVPDRSKQKVLTDILPDYEIVLDKKAGELRAGCQTLSKETAIKLADEIIAFFG